LPKEPPPILVAAGGPDSASLAAENDGLVTTGPSPKVMEAFDDAGGESKPRYGQLTICWARDEAEAKRTARHFWPTTLVPPPIHAELPRPSHFEALVKDATEEQVAANVLCGPDPERYIERIKSYLEAGLDHVYFHQVGPDQEGFLQFFQQELFPKLGKMVTPFAA
jgi:G6PDH family F420-dependent oxidoreductase